MEREYLRWCILSHLKVANKVSKVIYDFDFKPIPKIFIVYDLDKTLTAEDSNTVYQEYNNHLCSLNPRIYRERFSLEKCIEEIDKSPADFSEPQTRYWNILKRCKLKKEQHEEACLRTAKSKNIKIVPYAFQAFLEQTKIGCELGINTGSPRDVAALVSKEKIGIPKAKIAGSELIFDQDGYFKEGILNLGKNKVISMSNFFLQPENCYCDCSFILSERSAMYVTDDLEFDKHIAAKVGLEGGVVLYVGKKEYERKEFIISAPEIRKDLRRINPYVQLYRRAKLFATLVEPENANEIVKILKKIKQEENGKKLKEMVEKFLELNPLFPRIRSQICKKSKKEELTEILEENEPLFNLF